MPSGGCIRGASYAPGVHVATHKAIHIRGARKAAMQAGQQRELASYEHSGVAIAFEAQLPFRWHEVAGSFQCWLILLILHLDLFVPAAAAIAQLLIIVIIVIHWHHGVLIIVKLLHWGHFQGLTVAFFFFYAAE